MATPESFTINMLQLSMTVFASVKITTEEDTAEGLEIIHSFIRDSCENELEQHVVDELLSKYHEGITKSGQVKNDLYRLSQK